MVCRALSECLQSMVLKGMCQLSLLSSNKFHHVFHNWIIEEEHDMSGDRRMSHIGFIDSYPVRMEYGFVPILTAIVACGPFWPSGCCFVSWILCLLILGPFFYPLSIHLNDLHLLTITLPHFFRPTLGATENARKKEVWGSKAFLLSSRAYTSLSFGRCEICFFWLVPSGHRANSTRTMKMIPAIS